MELIHKIRLLFRRFPLFFSILKFFYRLFIFIITLPFNTIIYFLEFAFKLLELFAIKNKKLIFFLCSPLHSNYGDQLIKISTLDLLRKIYPDYKIVIFSRLFFALPIPYLFIKLLIKSSSIIVFNGGNILNESTPSYRVYIKILTYFRKYKIVFMPFSIGFKNNSYLNEFINFANQCLSIKLFTRDTRSYDTLSSFKGNFRLYNVLDIAATFQYTFPIDNYKSNRFLLIFRTDGEGKLSNIFLKKLILFLNGLGKVNLTDLYIPILGSYFFNFRKLIIKKLFHINKFQYVLTDRLHGIYFSLIANSKVISFDTIDSKIKDSALQINERAKKLVVNHISITDINSIQFHDNDFNTNEILKNVFDSNYKDMINFILE